MALPIQNTPIHTLEIPSTKEQFKFRPFLVKEQKALLLAQQSEDTHVMVDTLKNVIKSCAQSKIDVDSLAVFDLEYVFSQIRAKSVGENVELFFYCDTCEDDKAKVKIIIDLTKLKVENFPNHTAKISLFDDVGVMMKYPNINVIDNIDKIGTASSEVDLVFDIITDCIEYIYDTNEVYYAKEQSKQELADFVNNLTAEQFSKVEEFFETMPKLRKEVDYRCPVCQKEHHKVLEGLNNFF
jgi:Zn finger protein HypA/HybF involved in hydrogenase expression